MLYIIGVGGVGSWMAPAMCLLTGKNNVILVDGDKLERKNLNRQLFTDRDIGQNKATVLAEKYGCGFIDRWYSETMMQHQSGDWLICVVDNHPGRLSVLRAADMSGCRALFAANETHSSEAFVYLPEWQGTKLDPRIYYPDINTDQQGDPRRASIGCTGEAQASNVQLVSANAMASSLAMWLYVIWGMEAKKFDNSVFEKLPYKLVANMTKLETHRICDAK